MKKNKLLKQFDSIWEKAEKRNNELGAVFGFDQNSGARFHKIFTTSISKNDNNRFFTMGIYDSINKKYALFDSINLSGNYRYNKNNDPVEFNHMLDLIKSD